MNRKPTRPTLKTWEFYSACLHILDKAFLADLYKKSHRQIERWASDPDTSASHQRNPIDRYENLLHRLMERGRYDIARDSVARQCHIVGCDYPTPKHFPDPDNKSLMAECLDDLPTVAEFHAVLNNPDATQEEVRHAMYVAIDKLKQNYVKWCQLNGETDGKEKEA